MAERGGPDPRHGVAGVGGSVAMTYEAPRSLAEVRGFGYRSAGSTESAGVAAEAAPPMLFVIGAPRCGSTSLCRALKHHPQISFSFPKETHYLLQPRGDRSLESWRRNYFRRHHADLGPQHKLIGDGSVSYIYAPETIERALEFDPRARFIAVLRNPLEMIQSYHLRMLYLLDEDVADFDRAWSLQERRAAGLDLPPRCRDPRLLQYGEIGRHARHIERLFAQAGRERCLVLLFDDLRHDPRAVYLQMLEFLQLPDDGQTRFRHKRGSLAFRSRLLQRLLMNPPGWVLRLIQSAEVDDLPRLKRWRKRLKKINNREIERVQFPSRTRDMLRDYFAPDVDRLAVLLGRDLGHWLSDSPGQPADPEREATPAEASPARKAR